MNRAVFAGTVVVAAAMLTAPAASADPVVGNSCTDILRIASTASGQMLCTITGTGLPAGTTAVWKPYTQQLETVVKGSTCGPVGTNGDFRQARSTDNYLLWCVTRSYAQYPTWILATP